MKNRILGLILALIVLITSVPLYVGAATIIDSGTCGDNLEWTLDNRGILTISGTGKMYNYTYCTYSPWYSYRSSLSTVIIEDGVTCIGDYAFDSCSSLISVTIGNSVTSIGESAFVACRKLPYINIPKSVTNIGEGAFCACNSLETIKVAPDNTFFTTDSYGALYSSDYKTIYDYPEVNPATHFTMHYGVERIADYAIMDAKNLTTITLPETVKAIGYEGFSFNMNLQSIFIPRGLKSIERDAFKACDSLTDVHYGGTEQEWESISISATNNDKLLNANIHYNSCSENVDSNNKLPDSLSDAFAVITYKDTSYNLLSQPINIDADTSVEVKVKINYKEYTGKEKIYITQSAENAVVLENNVYKVIKPAEAFESNKDIYILIVNEETGESFSKRTQLRIVDNIANGEWMPDGDVGGLNFKLGKETGFTIPESIPVFGGTEIKWDFDFIPISFEYDREDDNKINIVFGTNIAHSDGKKDKYFKDFDFKSYKKAFKKATTKQDRTFKQLRNDFMMTNAYKKSKMKLFGGKVIGGGTGEPSFDFDVAGYAEAKIIDGNFTFVEGQLCIEAECSYEYQGQLFIWVVPICYSIGGGLGAGFEGDMINIDPESFVPEFEAYLTAKIKAELGLGLGVKVASVGVSGEGSLNMKTALHKEYLKAWGEGNANFNIKLFGKVVAKKEFAEGDFLIYETGNSNGMIKDDAVSLGSGGSSGNGGGGGEGSIFSLSLFNSIDPDGVYENESRAYLSSPTNWLGDDPSISLMNETEFTSKNITMLSSNVYTESAPQICEIDNKKVMVMLWDKNDRADIDRTMLVYSVYDDTTGLWSEPVAVYDDGTADFYPSFKDGYLAWQNEKTLLSDTMTLSDIAKLGEIYVARWNGEGFDVPVALTDNDTLDTLPTVCSDGENASVVWMTNTENDIIGITGTNSIIAATFDGAAWGTPIEVNTGLGVITHLSAGYADDVLNIAYVIDEDGDLQTIDDRDIRIVANGGVTKITENQVLDSNPVFDGDMLYYYSGGNIVYTNLSDFTVGTVFDGVKAGLTDTFTVDSNALGDTAIWWSKNVDSGMEVFCVTNIDGEWGDEVQISSIGNQSRYPTGIMSDDGGMYVAFANSTWQNSEIVQTDLYTAVVTPSFDLSVSNVYMDEETMTVYATVKNSGELAIASYIATLTDSEVNAERTFETPLKAGEVSEIEIAYEKPEDLNKRIITLNVSIPGVEEYNLENNIVEISIGNCDLEVTSVVSHEVLPNAYAVATLTNIGYSDTGNVTIFLRKNSADGEIVDYKTLSNIEAGKSIDVVFDYNAVSNDDVIWYITASAENEEISLGNNDKYIVNNYVNTVDDYAYAIVKSSISVNTLIVNAYAENNTSEPLDALSVLAVYDKYGKMKTISYKKISIPKYDSLPIDFNVVNYSFEEGDYVKLFMWDSFITMKSILVTESHVLSIE